MVWHNLVNIHRYHYRKRGWQNLWRVWLLSGN